MSVLTEENTLLESLNARLTSETRRLAQQVQALEADPGHLLARACFQDDHDPSFHHVVHGSREALEQVRRLLAIRGGLEASQAALEVTGRALRIQMERADRAEARETDLAWQLQDMTTQRDRALARVQALEPQVRP